MILYITKHQAVLAFWINEMADTLSMIEFRIGKGSFFVSLSSVSDLLNELVGLCIDDYKPVV